MNYLTKWKGNFPRNLFEEIDTIFDSLQDRFFCNLEPFESSFGNIISSKFGYPRLDIYDEKDHTLVRASIPGVGKDDLKVTINKGLLTISGQAKSSTEKDNENYMCREIKSSKFTRSVGTFSPDLYDLDIKKITMTLDKGILEIKIPKKEEQKKKDETITLEL